jgi:hypothetical protein
VLSEPPLQLSVPGSSMPPMMDLVIAQFDRFSMEMFPCVEVNGSMDYEPEPSNSLGAMAKAKGVRPLEVMYDFLCEGDGSNSIDDPIFNYAPGDLSKVYEMLLPPAALCSLADGGAHVGTICDASCTTTMLAHWALQRTRGPRIPLPQVVEMLTRRTVHGPGRPRRDRARHEGGPEPGGVGPLGTAFATNRARPALGWPAPNAKGARLSGHFRERTGGRAKRRDRRSPPRPLEPWSMRHRRPLTQHRPIECPDG